MQSVNSRGTFLVSRAVLPWLLQSQNNPHILTLSPPLTYGNLTLASAKDQLAVSGSAYALSKFGMSIVSQAIAAETGGIVGVNLLWPYTMIDTAALQRDRTAQPATDVRQPGIMAEAAIRIFSQDGAKFS